jgi:NitT/TauT family transport system substrate-binding protein
MDKHKQKLIVFGMALLGLAGALPAQSASGEPLTVYAIRGPSGVAMIRLFENPPVAAGGPVKMEALAQADLIAARFIAGEAKAGMLPPNVAAKIASAGKRIQVAAVTGTGMLSLLTGDSSIRSFGDLKGKSIEVAGQGATPDFVFRRILRFRGFDPDRDMRLNYSLAYPEIAQALIAGRVSTALLPEPFATMARSGRPDLRAVSDVQLEWRRAGGIGNYPMTVLAVDADYARSDPAGIRSLLAAIKASSEWVTANPAEAGALVEKHDLGLRAPVVAAAIPRSNYVFISAREARPALEALYETFLQYSPESIGGKLPGDAFYLDF